MARIRSIKPEFWDSPDTASADLRTRLLYIAMWNWADDYGIGDATPGRLINFAFPNDGISAADYPTLLADVSRSFSVVFFTFGGRPFYVIPAWETHQRTEKKAKARAGLVEAAADAISAAQGMEAECPTNVADYPTHSTDDSALEQGNGGTGEMGTGEREEICAHTSAAPIPAPEAPGKPTPRKRGTRIPSAHWMPDPRTVEQIQADFPGITNDQLRHEHNRFIDWATGSASRNAVKLDWDATWRGWMRRELPKCSTVRMAPAPSDARVARVQALKTARQEITA